MIKWLSVLMKYFTAIFYIDENAKHLDGEMDTDLLCSDFLLAIMFCHKVFSAACCCSVTQSCLTLCNALYCSMPGFPVLHHLPEFAQTHVHWVGDAIHPSCPLSSPSPAFNLSQHQGLFQWINSSHQVAKALELQHQFLSVNIQGWFLLGLTGLIFPTIDGWASLVA